MNNKKQNGFITLLAIIIIPIAISAIGGLVAYKTIQNRNVGTVIPKVVAVFETSLASKITASSTSMTLVSGTTDDSTTLSGFYGFVVDEGTADEEFITATCADTACTGLTRGISVTTGNTEIYALKKIHRRGASVKISDHPTLTILSRILNGDETIPNKISYASEPTFISGSSELATYNAAEDLANAGAATASTSTKGIVTIANSDQRKDFSTTTSDGGQLVLRLWDFATSTDKHGATTTPVMTDTDGKIDQSFLPLSENIRWTGSQHYSASTTNSATSTHTGQFIVTASSTMASTTFTGIPTLPSFDPTNDNHAVRLGSIQLGVFGDGYMGASTTAANLTLTEDKYFSSWTINSGVTVTTGGFRIFVSGTLTNNGVISATGSDAVTTEPGAGAAGNSETPLGGGGAGGDDGGGTGAGGGGGGVMLIAAKTLNNSAGTITVAGGRGADGIAGGAASGGSVGGATTTSLGGSGGHGGGSTEATGGSNGTTTVPSVRFGGFHDIINATTLRVASSTATWHTNLVKGGGGGGGGSGGTGTNDGAGGGGGGGAMVLIYSTLISGTESVAGGSGGTGAGTGEAGTAGSSGTKITIDVL